jgi:hypothetical protein
MANRVVKNTLKHYYDDEPRYSPDGQRIIPEPDKTKSISEMSLKELKEMLSRLHTEREVQYVIKELKRNSGEQDNFDNPFIVDTKTPINQLYHYGILGQKWGVRRFQREDGTRTPAGKKRDGNRQGNSKEKPKSKDHMQSRVAKAKGTDGLSNEELKKLNERLQLEETYRKLTATDIKKGESWVKQSISTAGKAALTEFTKGIFLGSAKLLVRELSPELATTAFQLKEKKDD